MNAKKSIITTLLFFTSLAVLYFFLLPNWNKLNNSKTRLDQAELEQQRLLAAKADLSSFLSEFESMSEEVDTLNRALPLKQAEYSQILAGLDEMAKSSGLVLGNLSFSEPTEAQLAAVTNHSIQVQEVTFTSSGSFPSFRNFLLRAENALRIIDIETIDLRAEGGAGLLNFTTKFKTYYQTQLE